MNQSNKHTIKVDIMELRKVEMNRLLFGINKSDHFEIDKTLEILCMDKLPIEIPMNNNVIFIRDLSTYIVTNNLKPNIGK